MQTLYAETGTRTIPAEGCIGNSKKTILPAFRAINALDPCRGLHGKFQKRNFTSIPCQERARPLQTLNRKKILKQAEKILKQTRTQTYITVQADVAKTYGHLY